MLGITQLVNELLDQGKQVAVLDRVLIKATTVLDRSQGAVTLQDKEERGCHGGVGVSDPSSTKILLKEFVQGLLFIVGE